MVWWKCCSMKLILFFSKNAPALSYLLWINKNQCYPHLAEASGPACNPLGCSQYCPKESSSTEWLVFPHLGTSSQTHHFKDKDKTKQVTLPWRQLWKFQTENIFLPRCKWGLNRPIQWETSYQSKPVTRKVSSVGCVTHVFQKFRTCNSNGLKPNHLTTWVQELGLKMSLIHIHSS